MKRTYAAPTVAFAGNVVRETLGGAMVGSETPIRHTLGAGRLGFYL
jgi:hypothetical protein